jgi:hypothetical protein
MASAGLIFNSVTSFVLSPQKTKRKVKRDDLDTLQDVWTGPAGAEDGFIPVIGTRHPDYNLMTLIDAGTKQLPGLVVEVTLSYHGKLDNTGTSSYTSVPTISRYWAEGEVGYQSGTLTLARRYSGRCVTFAYITNRVPTGNPTNLGTAKEFLGFKNVWDQVVNQGLPPPPGSTITTQRPPIEQMTCTDVRTEDTADGWYKVIETYQSRMFPGETITEVIPQLPIFLGFKPLFNDGTSGTPKTSDTAQESANQTNAAAQTAGDKAGVTVPVSTSGAALDVAQSTGLDPAYIGSSDVDPSLGAYEGNVTDLIATAQSAVSTTAPPPDVNTGAWELGGTLFPGSRVARLNY